MQENSECLGCGFFEEMIGTESIKIQANRLYDQGFSEKKPEISYKANQIFSLYLNCRPTLYNMATYLLQCPECPYQKFRRNPRKYSRY